MSHPYFGDEESSVVEKQVIHSSDQVINAWDLFIGMVIVIHDATSETRCRVVGPVQDKNGHPHSVDVLVATRLRTVYLSDCGIEPLRDEKGNFLGWSPTNWTEDTGVRIHP